MFVPFRVSLPASLVEAANRLFDADGPPPASAHFYFDEIERGGGMDWLKMAANMLPLPVRLEFESWVVAQEKYRFWAGMYATHLMQYGYKSEQERGEKMLSDLGKDPTAPAPDEAIEFVSVDEHDVIATPAASIEFGLVSDEDAIVIMEALDGMKHFVICPKNALLKALEGLCDEAL